MRRTFLLGCFLAAGLWASAQGAGFYFGGNDNGGYGALLIENAFNSGGNTLGVGAAGAFLANGRWAIGGYGMGHQPLGAAEGEDYRFASGGLYLGLRSPINEHLSFELATRSGFGSIWYEEAGTEYRSDLVSVTLDMGLGYRLSRGMALSFQGGYRFVPSLDADAVPRIESAEALGGFFVMLGLQFGSYGD